MPRKGLFTQSAVVLLRSTPSVGAIEDALARFPLAGRLAVVDGENGWMGGYPGVLVAFRPDVNGLVMVDVVPTRWPDAMGSPETEPELFAAWSLGWFGPFVYPGNLARAIRWAGDLDASADLVRSHTAFLRVKSTYALGAADDSALIPADNDALAELRFVTEMARALLELPDALTYFNPAGERLHVRSRFDEIALYHERARLPPYDLWTATRSIKVEKLGSWALMDTIGLEQLDIRDHEAAFAPGTYDPDDVASFLRNATHYVRENGPVLCDGDTMDGPGERRWQVHSFDNSLAVAPREVMRWLPMDGVDGRVDTSIVPAALLDG